MSWTYFSDVSNVFLFCFKCISPIFQHILLIPASQLLLLTHHHHPSTGGEMLFVQISLIFPEQHNFWSYRWPQHILESYRWAPIYKCSRQKCRIKTFLQQKCSIYTFLCKKSVLLIDRKSVLLIENLYCWIWYGVCDFVQSILIMQLSNWAMLSLCFYC